MNIAVKNIETGSIPFNEKAKMLTATGAVIATLALAVGIALHPIRGAGATPSALAAVGVSTPVQRELDTQATFLGQYSAVDKVELRAQVAGVQHEVPHVRAGRVGDVLERIGPGDALGQGRIQAPFGCFAIGLSAGPVAGGQPRDLEPWMVFEQLNVSLAHHSGGAQNADRLLGLHDCELFSVPDCWP